MLTITLSSHQNRYFLPEDGDNEDAPNVFLAPKPNRPGYPPLLGQIKNAFPLPGTYHYRFKTALVPGTDREKNAVPVWMDCVDDSQPVPVWQGSIIAKVTRISLDEDEYDEDFDGAGHSRTESNVSSSSVHSSTQPKPVNGVTATTQSIHSSDSLLGAFDDPEPAPAASAASSVHSSAENLLDVDNHNHHIPSAPASGGSLLDMDHHTSGANTPTPNHNELLNMAAPSHHGAPPPQQQAPPMQGQYPMHQQQGGQYPMQHQGGMGQMPPTPQNQQQQRSQQNGGNKTFDSFSDPMSNLKW